MKNKANQKIIFFAAGTIILSAVFAVLVSGVSWKSEEKYPRRVRVAVSDSEWVADFDTNYYTLWLEEKTNCDIEFVRLEKGFEKESLEAMLRSEHSGVDAVFLPASGELVTFLDYYDYISEGLLFSPTEILGENSELQNLKTKFPEIDLSPLIIEDKMYCFPAAETSRVAKNMQVLWINVDWLQNLGLKMPRTADELCGTLRAFRDRDPNKNGKKDELPLVSSESASAFKSYIYLLNAYSFYDEKSLPEDEGFRKGVIRCAELYSENILSPSCFGYSAKQLSELINDPADTVGAFTAHSIADAVYTNNPGILAHFVQLSPVSSEYSPRGFSVENELIPRIGGLIPANSQNKSAAAQIMDTMLSDEASLIALYGEENSDWRFSKEGELSTYGAQAKITTLRYLKNERQNRNFAGAGPLLARPEFYDGVTWNGDHSMTEYIDARAVKAYEEYRQKSSPAPPAASEYLKTELFKFITGEKDPKNEADWQNFKREYERLK